MTIPTRADEFVMGDGIRSYHPSVFNPNIVINSLFAPSPRAAFPTTESAVVIQQKKIPDVSFWQGEIDWDLMRSKTDTVIIRAGQNVWEDIQFKRNVAEAKVRGMIWTIYFFYDDRVSPGVQAELLVSLIKDNLPQMEIIIDWEKTFGGPFRGLPNVVAMMEAVESALPVRTALYSGYFWFRGNSNAIANASQYNYLKARPLHLAWYTDNAANVLIPNPWQELWLWQYGTPAEGEAHGARTKEIDQNYINMTDPEFYLRYGGTEPQPDPEEPMPPLTITEGTVSRLKLGSTINLMIRKGPGTGHEIIGSLQAGDKVYGVIVSAVWLDFEKIVRLNGATQMFHGFASTQYMDIRQVPIEPQPEPTPTPEPSLPAYFKAYDAAGNELGRYNKQ